MPKPDARVSLATHPDTRSSRFVRAAAVATISGRWTSPTPPRTRRSATSCAAWLDENLPKFLADWGGDERLPGGGRARVGGDREPHRRRSAARTGSARSTRAAGPRSTGRRSGAAARPRRRRTSSTPRMMARVPRARHLQRQRHLADRPDDHPLGHRGAEGAVAARHPQRRRALVPGLHRAAGRLRPRQPAHAPRSPTATTTSSTARRSGSRPRTSRKWGLFLVRTDPTAIERGAQARGHHRVHRRHGDARHRVPPDPRHHRRRDVQRGVLHRRADPGRRTASATRARAGWSRWARSATSGSAPPGSRSRWRADLRRHDRPARAVNPDALRRPRDPRAHRPARTPRSSYTAAQLPGARRRSCKGEKNWPEVPLAKLQWSHLAQTLAELAVDLLGPAGAAAPRAGPTRSTAARWTRHYVWQRYTSIGAGTTEVQKNIIADRALAPPQVVPRMRLGIVTPVLTRLPRAHASWEDGAGTRRRRAPRGRGRAARLLTT